MRDGRPLVRLAARGILPGEVSETSCPYRQIEGVEAYFFLSFEGVHSAIRKKPLSSNAAS